MTDLEYLQQWQEEAREVIRALIPLAITDSPTGEGGICQICKAHLPVEGHKAGCKATIGLLLLNPYTILANLHPIEEARNHDAV